MGWGSRVHRPCSSGAHGGKTARYRPRVVIAVNEITISEAMTTPLIVLPQYGRDLNYATDLYQRLYVAPSTPYQIRRSVSANGALYSSTVDGDGNPPGPESTWTIVASSELGALHLDDTRHTFQTPTWFTGLTHVDLWTWVSQNEPDFTEPFTVIHELWGNFFRWNRPTNSTIAGRKPEQINPSVKDTSIRLLGRARG